MDPGQILDQFEAKPKEYSDFYYTETGELRQKLDIPGERGIRTKTLLGIVFCLLGALVGLLLLRQSLIQAKDVLETYKKNPDLYKRSSYLAVKKSENLAYFGLLGLCALVVLTFVILIALNN